MTILQIAQELIKVNKDNLTNDGISFIDSWARKFEEADDFKQNHVRSKLSHLKLYDCPACGQETLFKEGCAKCTAEEGLNQSPLAKDVRAWLREE